MADHRWTQRSHVRVTGGVGSAGHRVDVAPRLIVGQQQFDVIGRILRHTLTETRS